MSRIVRYSVATLLILLSLALLGSIFFFSIAYLGILGICECFDVLLFAKVIATDLFVSLVLIMDVVLVVTCPAIALLSDKANRYLKNKSLEWFVVSLISLLLTPMAYFLVTSN